MTPDFDAIVLGAGVIGLAVARELTLVGKSVLVLEKAADIGTETSSRNSEVIHAGIYYPTGTLKARLCVEGRKLLYEYCASHGVEAKRIGKLIVATSAEEEAKLTTIKALADANNVTDLIWLSQAEAQSMEPEVRCSKGLFSPSTGIVDGKGFMLSLQGGVEAQGGTFAFNTTFLKASRSNGSFVVTALNEDGSTSEITCNNLINAAGHGGHQAAGAIAGYPVELLPQRFLARGDYCSCSGKSPFTHLIYPVPVSGALGIHATLDLAGAVRFGPDIAWIDALDYTMPSGLPAKFSAAVERYWPEVRSRELAPTYSGIRPKTHGPKEGFSDFTIQGPETHGIAGLVNLFGIESPGLTSSLAIAKNVLALL